MKCVAQPRPGSSAQVHVAFRSSARYYPVTGSTYISDQSRFKKDPLPSWSEDFVGMGVRGQTIEKPVSEVSTVAADQERCTEESRREES